MKPSIEELIEDLTTIRMEQAIADALIIFSDAQTLQVLVEVTEKMQVSLEKEDFESVPNLKEEVQMFEELHAHDIYDEHEVNKALLKMQITINQAVIDYVKKAYQDAHCQDYLSQNIDHINALLSDE